MLSALGAGALLELAESRRASGAPPPAPLRFIGVYTPHGCARELYTPGPGFDIAYPNSVLAPFDDPATHGKSFRDRLLVVDGIDLQAGIAIGTMGHDAPRVILTGSGADGKNASIDQYLAYEQGLGRETPHTSLVLSVGNDQTDIGSNVSYAKGGVPVPKWIDPAQTFQELFGSPLAGKGPEELARERKLGRSVLDAVRADLSDLRARAPRAERVKLEQHADSLREIEKRLTHTVEGCDVPQAPDRQRFPKVRAYGGGEPYFDAITDLQVDLLARAIACDLTRFATLFLADLSRTGLFLELPSDVHENVAHRYDPRTDHYPGTPNTWYLLGIQNRYVYGKVARLLARLDEAGVLDDTILYVSGDMGDTAKHTSRRVPTLLAGGGGRFRTGRTLDLARGGSSGVPNNRILVSICQAFGVETNHFGHSADPKVVTGRLAELDG